MFILNLTYERVLHKIFFFFSSDFLNCIDICFFCFVNSRGDGAKGGCGGGSQKVTSGLCTGFNRAIWGVKVRRPRR